MKGLELEEEGVEKVGGGKEVDGEICEQNIVGCGVGCGRGDMINKESREMGGRIE